MTSHCLQDQVGIPQPAFKALPSAAPTGLSSPASQAVSALPTTITTHEHFPLGKLIPLAFFFFPREGWEAGTGESFLAQGQDNVWNEPHSGLKDSSWSRSLSKIWDPDAVIREHEAGRHLQATRLSRAGFPRQCALPARVSANFPGLVQGSPPLAFSPSWHTHQQCLRPRRLPLYSLSEGPGEREG